jgi:hypothetical protein
VLFIAAACASKSHIVARKRPTKRVVLCRKAGPLVLLFARKARQSRAYMSYNRVLWTRLSPSGGWPPDRKKHSRPPATTYLAFIRAMAFWPVGPTYWHFVPFSYEHPELVLPPAVIHVHTIESRTVKPVLTPLHRLPADILGHIEAFTTVHQHRYQIVHESGRSRTTYESQWFDGVSRDAVQAMANRHVGWLRNPSTEPGTRPWAWSTYYALEKPPRPPREKHVKTDRDFAKRAKQRQPKQFKR